MKTTPLAAGAVLVLLVPAIAFSDPLLRYTFDEASGDALDTGDAPAADGTLVGGATRSANTPGGSGSSIDFRIETPYAHVLSGDADKLDGLSTLTITTWLNVETYTSGNHRLAAKQAATTFGGFNFSMNAMPNDGPVGPDNFRLGMFIGNNVSSGPADFGAAFSTADVDAANKWVLLAVTYDNSLAADNTIFYIGGVDAPMAQLGAAVTLPQLTIEGGTARFGVGFTDAAPTADTSVIGLQDDVRVYGAVLDLTALEAVRAEAVASPGNADFDGDGDVDGADFLTWQRGVGMNGTQAEGNADEQGAIDGADLAIWKNQFGGGNDVSAVPEPAAVGLAVFIFGVLLRQGGRRRRPQA